MVSAGPTSSWRRRLSDRLRTTVAELSRSTPVCAAVVIARSHYEGGFEVVAAANVPGEGQRSDGLDAVLTQAAIEWLEVNRRELILEIRPQYSQGELYRPLIEQNIPAALILPVVQCETLSGAMVLASPRRTCYTDRDVRLIRLAVRTLINMIPPPDDEAWQQAVADAGVEVNAGTEATEHAAQVFVPLQEDHSVKAELLSGTSSTPEAEEEEGIRFETDMLGRIDTLKGDVRRLLGWERDDVLGSCLALIHRNKCHNLLDPKLRVELLRNGRFKGRAVCYSEDGRPITCEIEIAEIRSAEGRISGYRGVIRTVPPRSLLPHEKVEFGFARLYAFMNPLKPRKT